MGPSASEFHGAMHLFIVIIQSGEIMKASTLHFGILFPCIVLG